jgi:drug/metabolite transporter (DMT)-like permease
MAWCVLAAVLFGASTPATKQFTQELDAFQIAGLLYAGAGLCVSPWALFRRSSTLPTRRQRLYLLGALISGGVIGPVLLVMGLARAPAGSVALWLNLETVATAVLARAFFKEHLGMPTLGAIGLIIVASLLLSSQGSYGFSAAGLVALACLAWGLDNNLTSLIGSYTPTQITFAKGLLGAGVNLGLSAYLTAGALEPRAAASVMLIGALGYGVSLVLYVSSAQQLGATRSQPHDRLVHSHWHRHDDDHHHHHDPLDPLVPRWHAHEHVHPEQSHAHPHLPDLHHRHRHRDR